MTTARTPWWDDYLVAFDLETTSPEPEVARIVTAHVSLVDPSGGADGRTLVIDPGVPIPDEAAAIHGYTTERARAEGMERTFGIGALWGLLRKLAARHPVAPFNGAYDFTVLDRECRRLGLEPLAPRPVIDAFVLDKAVDRYRRGKRTLGAVAEHYGVPLLDAHDAAADALAAVGVARAIGRRYASACGDDWSPHGAGPGGVRLLSPDPDTMHDWQVEYRAEQAASLQDYLRRTDPTAVVDGSWPVKPLGALGVRP